MEGRGPRREQPTAGGEDFVLVQGLRETRGALDRWSGAPGPVLGPWFAGGLAVAAGLLAAVWVVSLLSTPDATPFFVPGVSAPVDSRRLRSHPRQQPAGPGAACHRLRGGVHRRQLAAARRPGDDRRSAASIHEKAGPLAIAWVVLVTTFSLFAQAFALGFDGATLSAQLDISPALLIVTVLPHALLELTAIFLPLAAWLIASRRIEWEDLLAATFVTVGAGDPDAARRRGDRALRLAAAPDRGLAAPAVASAGRRPQRRPAAPARNIRSSSSNRKP